MVVSFTFLKEVPSKLEIQCKKRIYFLVLVGIPSSLMLSIKNRVGIYLTDKICEARRKLFVDGSLHKIYTSESKLKRVKT